MKIGKRKKRKIIRAICYVLVAVLSSTITFLLTENEQIIYNVVSNGSTTSTEATGEKKLKELASILDAYFVEDVDDDKAAESMAAAMVASLGDRWSYYMNADEYKTYVEQMNNAYVGIGVTISTEEDTFFEVLRVEKDSGAAEAGIQPGDKIVGVDGKTVEELGSTTAKAKIKGEADTKVPLTVKRGEEEFTVDVTRKVILLEVASGKMLDNHVALITISNFDDRCAEETIAAIEEMIDQGAKGLVFDVRGNPGGYKDELVDLLNYILPEGQVFRSIDYKGEERIDTSDAACVKMPMAVLMNKDSYSAAEFFAAALEEYDWAVTVGQATTGKSRFQNTYKLSDGSAVNISVGQYFTPKGVSLTDTGGLKPQIEVEIEDEMLQKLYAGVLDAKDDPQVQEAVDAVLEKIG